MADPVEARLADIEEWHAACDDHDDIMWLVAQVRHLVAADTALGDLTLALQQCVREHADAHALLAEVGRSGIAWRTAGYVEAHIDRQTWEGIVRAVLDQQIAPNVVLP